MILDSVLNLNIHFHMLFLDGAYIDVYAPDDDPSHHLLGHSITYRIAMGPQQGRKVLPNS